MFFDDRLATVLRHRAAGEHAARTQFRQLLDLLGSRKYGRDESLVAAAWLRLGALGEQIPAKDRAQMVREPGWKFRSPELAAHLAEDEPEVAAAALARANLDEEDWEALIPRLPIRARGFLRFRRDLPDGAEAILDRLGITDRGLPQPDHSANTPSDEEETGDTAPDTILAPPPVETDDIDATEGADASDSERIAPAPRPSPPLATPPGETIRFHEQASAAPSAGQPRKQEEKSEITALVERIEQFRREREAGVPPVDNSPQLPLGEMPQPSDRGIRAFGFATDAAGRIEWADPAVAPMVIGKRLVPQRRLGEDVPLNAMARAFNRQQPIEGVSRTLEGAEAIEGEWVIDAQPLFARSGGRFRGYVGRFRRPAPEGMIDPRAASEADRIRQLLHELRTPVNALQGFAEVIQQQLFGPAPHEYRAHAAAIAGDAAHILAGFDEMDRLARLESGIVRPELGETDFRAVLAPMLEQIEHVLAPRMVSLSCAVEDTANGAWYVPLDQAEVEALLWRVLATIAGSTSAGETLHLTLSHQDGMAELDCELPSNLAAQDDLFSAQVHNAATGISAGLFGAGFTLRLARAEARGAGGSLEVRAENIVLRLPLLTVAAATNSATTTVIRSEADQHHS